VIGRAPIGPALAGAALGLALVAAVSPAPAEPAARLDPAPVPEPAIDATVHARIGSIAAPFYTPGIPEVRSEFQAYALVAEVGYAVRRGWRVGARLPIATSSIEQPAGSYTAAYTVGNVELHGQRALASPPWLSRLDVRVAVGAPLARYGGATLVRARVLAASDALEGWRDRELWTPGVLPVTASAIAGITRPRWSAETRLEIPALLRLPGAPEEMSTSPLGVVPNAAARVAWRPRGWIEIGVAGHVVALVPAPSTSPRDVGRSGRVQLGLTPMVAVRTGSVALELDAVIAAGGPLAGSIGVGAHIGWRR
jgi:hypothetical protein